MTKKMDCQGEGFQRPSPLDIVDDRTPQQKLLDQAGLSSEHVMLIDYTNWRGTRRWRPILPVQLVWGEYHHYIKGHQWMLEAYDLDDNAHTTEPVFFALSGIHASRPLSQGGDA